MGYPLNQWSDMHYVYMCFFKHNCKITCSTFFTLYTVILCLDFLKECRKTQNKCISVYFDLKNGWNTRKIQQKIWAYKLICLLWSVLSPVSLVIHILNNRVLCKQRLLVEPMPNNLISSISSDWLIFILQFSILCYCFSSCHWRQ